MRRLAPALVPAVYLTFTLAVWWQLWTPIDGAKVSWKYDPTHDYWGDLIYQYDSLRHGHIAMWNPWDRAGFPIYGDPHPGILYPPNWPFAIWGALTGAVPYVAIHVKIIAHWVFGSVGMHLLLRRFGAREPACYVSGLLFGWSAPKIRYGGNALNWSLDWIPWVLLAIHWFAEKPSVKRGIVLGSAASMVLLSGSPATVLYGLVICVPYLVYALWGRWRTAWKPLAVAGGVGLLWILPLVISQLEQLPSSVRDTRNLQFVGWSAFTPSQIAGFMVPRLFSENVYYGLIPILCAGMLVASQARTRALVFLGVAAAGVVLSLGFHAGMMPAIASALSPFTLFRRAHRYLYITSVAMAVLGGLGFAYMLSLESEQRKKELAARVVWVGGAATFAFGMGLIMALVTLKQNWGGKNDAFALAFMSAAVGTWLLRAILLNTGRRQLTYAWIAVVVVAIELWTANSKMIDAGFTKPVRTQNDHVVSTLGNLKTEWRIYDRGYLKYRAGTRLGIRDFGGYEDYPLSLKRYSLYLAAAKRNLTLLGHANVRYYLDGGRRPPVRPRSVDKMKAKTKGVWELPNVAPAVMYVPNARVVPDARAGLAALASITPGQGAVVEGTPPPKAPAGARAVAGRLVVLEPNRVVAEIDVPGPGLVVIAEAFYGPWQATLHGPSGAKDVKIQPANVMFRGVAVPAAGTYRIEMRLRPMRFWALLPAFFVAFGLLLWVLIGALRQRRTAAS